jgi:large subunit ribosomal protein L25
MSSTTHLSLKAKNRTAIGNIGKKFRKIGILPAVIYGFNIDKPVNVSLAYNDFEKVFRSAGSTTVLDLDVEGKQYQTLVHDLQYHPVRDTFIHIDFLSVNLKKVVQAEVPLIFVNIPAPVKQDGAVLNKSIESVTVNCLPDSIPHSFEIDLSQIVNPEDVIHVRDIKTPKGVTLENESDVVASVIFVNEGDAENETPETQVGTPATVNE